MQVFKVHVLSTQRTNAFVVDIQDVDQGKFTWQIEKMYDDFKHLKSAMKDKFTDENPTWKSMALFPTPESLGNFLTSALSFLGHSVWSYDPMLNFLDNVSQKSFISELKLIKLTFKVESLEKKSSDLEKSQELLLENFKAFQAKIDDYLRSGGETALSTAAGAPRLSWDSKVSEPHGIKMSDPHLSITSMATTESADESVQRISQSGDEPSDCGDDEVSSLRTPVSSSEYAPTRNSIALMTVNTGPSNRDSSMPNSIYLPSELFPLLVSNSANHPFEKVVESTLQKIAPVELQIQHRQSVVLLLKKLIRIALGSTAFEYGVQMTRCLLPDDPIKISVMLSKSLLPTWHTVLCEFLTAYAERANMYGGSNFVPPDEEEQSLDPYFQDLAPPANHFLGNVSHVKQNLMHSVTLIVDSIVVDITPNNRTELCLTSFLEDVSQVIGSNDLFKRSLLLVRAWWALEAQTYVGCSIRHYLTDFQLFVMLAGVFNQYSTFIKTPMIAFCFFLAEYSGYDGISKAISLRGFATFQTKTSNQPNLPDVKPHFVIPESLLEKYWVLFNISHAQEQQDQQQRKRSHSSSDDEPSISDGNGGNPNAMTNSRMGPSGESAAENVTHGDVDEHMSSLDKLLMIDAVRESMKALSANNLFLFDRSSYNIVHPLCHMNMITEKLSQRRVSRLAKAFQSSAVAVAAILRSSNNSVGVAGTTEQFDSMCACFSNIRAFNNLWNQAQLPVDLLSIMKDPFDMSKMLQSIQYSNLIIESAVSDEGLLILAQEILAVKGPLPVGEIGKVLAETTSIPNLSVKLKEKYGGLKRYLEAYQDRFVISNDHPFNPNVLLRCSLAPEHLEMIDKGNFPHHIVARAKKASAAAAAARRKKTAPSLSVSVTNVDPNSFTIGTTGGNNNVNATNTAGHSTSPMAPNGLPHSPLMAPGVNTSISANSGNASSMNAYNRPLSNPSLSQQQVSSNVANLTPQQQNLVHATVQKLKNVSQPPPVPLPSSSANNNGTTGMSLSVAQLAQQYGGNNSTNMMNNSNINRPKTFPAGGSGHNNLPPGAVKLPMPGLTNNNNNNNNNIYLNSNNNPNNGYFGANSGSNMRLGSSSYAASSVPMPQTRSVNSNNSVDLSAFANAAAAHWSQHQQQQMQQPSRRSSHNSEFNDSGLSNNLSSPAGGNSGNNSNNNSNHNSLNSSTNGNGLLAGGSRDNVRVLFGNSFVSNSNTNNNASSATNSYGKGTSLFDQTASSQMGFSSFLTNASNSTTSSANNSRPTSLGQSLTPSDPSINTNMNGFGSFGVMDVSKLGLDLDVLSLTAPNATLSSLSASSSILNNNSNNNNGPNSNNYNLW